VHAAQGSPATFLVLTRFFISAGFPASSKEVPSVEKFLVTTVPAPLNPHCLPIAARFLQFTISRKIFVFPVKSLLLAYCVALG
jgi:hypothetical protein